MPEWSRTRPEVEIGPISTVRAEDAAAHVGVSVRKLHQLYAATGTSFATVVREMRLEEVARELADRAAATPITEIAALWGSVTLRI